MDSDFLISQLKKALTRLGEFGIETELCSSCGRWEEILKGKTKTFTDDVCNYCSRKETLSEESSGSEEISVSEESSEEEITKKSKKVTPKAEQVSIAKVEPKVGKTSYDVHRYVIDDLLPKLKKENSDWHSFFSIKETLSLLQKISQDLSEFDNIQPSLPQVFNALTTSVCLHPKSIKVVLIGMDPYPTKGAAMGLAFSHSSAVPTQKSLLNIYKELKSDGYTCNEKSGDLRKWVEQGVFLINAALTVTEGKSGSHSKVWKDFTEALFRFLNKLNDNLVVIMWGMDAQKLGKRCFDNQKHKFLVSTHPSPQAISGKNANFFGSKPFSKANEYLKEKSIKPVDWNLS